MSRAFTALGAVSKPLTAIQQAKADKALAKWHRETLKLLWAAIKREGLDGKLHSWVDEVEVYEDREGNPIDPETHPDLHSKLTQERMIKAAENFLYQHREQLALPVTEHDGMEYEIVGTDGARLAIMGALPKAPYDTVRTLAEAAWDKFFRDFTFRLTEGR